MKAAQKAEETTASTPETMSLKRSEDPKSSRRGIAQDAIDTHSTFGGKSQGALNDEVNDQVAFRISDTSEDVNTSETSTKKNRGDDPPVTEAKKGMTSDNVQLSVEAFPHARFNGTEFNTSGAGRDFADDDAASEALAFRIEEPGTEQDKNNSVRIPGAEGIVYFAGNSSAWLLGNLIRCSYVPIVS
jgi:hypothetical protein